MSVYFASHPLSIVFFPRVPNLSPLLFLPHILFFLIYVLAALGLHCCTRAFSSCRQQGLLFVVVQASHLR